LVSAAHSSDSIHFSHVHLLKYEKALTHSPRTFAYTRIGLGDANNNSFLFQYCKLKNAPTSCFHILKEPNEQMMSDNCYYGKISLDEIQDHEYMLNESLITDKSKNNRVLMGRTNNFMPYFINNFLNYTEFVTIRSSKHLSKFDLMKFRNREHKRKINPRLLFLN
jgi:hypothetical protein